MERHYSTYPYIFRHSGSELESGDTESIFNAGMRESYFRALAKAQQILFDPKKNKSSRK